MQIHIPEKQNKQLAERQTLLTCCLVCNVLVISKSLISLKLYNYSNLTGPGVTSSAKYS